MSQVQKVAARLETKLAQQMSGIRPYNMGTLDKPNINNIVKNIQSLVDAFNYLSYEVNELKKAPTASDSVAQQLEQSGVTITQT
jgi:hypothetical protein